MQPDRFEQAAYWLTAASQDVEVARRLQDMPNVACFHAQQASEKALKGLLSAVAGETARSHTARRLLDEALALGIEIPEEIAGKALALDKFYIPPRYPDALGGVDVTTAFTGEEAATALTSASVLVAFARKVVAHERERRP
ncbi:MAG: HEPN domain-containing protein [Vulcanimicrobiaceae bacterium]